MPPLVGAGWLRDRVDDPRVVAVEVDAEPAHYAKGHLPGAVALDWTRDLHEPVRRAFLGPERFEALVDAQGLDGDTHVVFYGATDPGFAANAYWIFRYYGHPRISLLDGGKAGWLAAGHGLTGEVTARRPSSGHRGPEPDRALRVPRDELLARFVGAPDGTVLVDGRSPGEFEGRIEHPLDLPMEWHRVSGHVPGAVNLPATELLDDDGAFRPLPELWRAFTRRGIRPGQDDVEVAVYCRLGEVSSLLWFALHELLGHRPVRNYDGGWVEYGSLTDVPVERRLP